MTSRRFSLIHPSAARHSQYPAYQRSRPRQNARSFSFFPELAQSLGKLESYLHPKKDGMPTLVRAGPAYVQLGTIHPFLGEKRGYGAHANYVAFLSHGHPPNSPSFPESFPKTESANILRIVRQRQPLGRQGDVVGFFLQRNSGEDQ